MSKQPSRRGRARPHSLRKSAYVLLMAGLLLVVAALASPRTRLEAAGGGLLLIGVPLFVLGCVLLGLEWMAAYTATSDGPWDQQTKATNSQAASRGFARSELGGNSSSTAPSRSASKRSRSRSRRAPLFGPSRQSSAFGVSMTDKPLVEPMPLAVERTAPTVAAATPATVATVAITAPRVPAQPAPAVPAPVAAAKPVSTPTGPTPTSAPKTGDRPGDLVRADPGPDTLIEEFVII